MTDAPMLPSRTYSMSIDRDWRDLYAAIWRPEVFPRWASGLAESALRPEGDGWMADGPEGPVRIRFTPHNDHGVMDHVVEVSNGADVHVPMRIVANGRGAEVMVTLFRQPGMSDERFAADAKWIHRDLQRLKSLARSL
ncbi:polyketide cyclase [Sphingomonas donggukensis]|uniref:Polyketide cyclase n=1 Tax=Sphingomonas donggukensis TaxID=2949093 RepID=A0ABY4TUF8_9SPHN|nr:polyketide cyclase [Sphingomonas donggukensis]URW74794.1 polyketide cyclase [Sphingomonas donggukensis]